MYDFFTAILWNQRAITKTVGLLSAPMPTTKRLSGAGEMLLNRTNFEFRACETQRYMYGACTYA